MMLTVQGNIEHRVHGAIFGNPIIGNTLRGLFVEAMIAEALTDSDWDWVGADWASWDFEHRKTWVTAEVKQSAALQSWSKHYSHAAQPRFDIAERTGYWYQLEGAAPAWHAERCRPADLFIFAWHDRLDGADQRDVSQWQFYVCQTDLLPPKTRSIGLGRLSAITSPCGWSDLASKVEAAAAQVKEPRQRKA